MKLNLNQSILRIIATMIEPMDPGTTFKTETVFQAVLTKYPKWRIIPNRIGSMIKQRDDVRSLGHTTWEKI